jgi:hypothetical protein
MNWLKLKEKLWLQIFIIYTRYLIGGAFVFASIIKIKGNRFTAESGAENPINSAWHFFETMYQSGLYWQFLGIGQLVAGGLLMTQRYAKLGALTYFPIIANVFVITISYDFRGTPFITGPMLLASIMLLLWDWNELKILVNQQPVFTPKDSFEKDIVWQILGLLLFVFTVTSRFFEDYLNLFIWFVGCILMGFIGLLVGLKKWRRKRLH